MGLRPLIFVLVTVLAAAAAATAHADTAPWLAPEWAVRRCVDVKSEPTRYTGAEVAVVTFYTGGQANADAGDVRVAVKGRQLTPHRVLQVGPGDLVRVAWAVVPGESRYYVYYGNPKAPAPDPWEPVRGVLLECRKWQGGVPKSLAEVREAWKKAAPIGADFVPNVSFGFNPFTETDTPALFHYTGWFVPAETGEYSIATSSDDDSWLFIDGKEVVSWPGTHGAVWDARHAAPLVLDTTLHRIDYWHVNQSGPLMAVAGWKTPKGTRYEPIPAKMFLPVAEGALVEREEPGKTMTADFFPENAGEAWWPDQYAVRMAMRNLSKNITVQGGGKFEWDFGDGQTSTAPNPKHIYLAAGDYTVTLKASRLGDSSTFRTKVRVERNWLKQSEQAIETSKSYAQEAASYDLTKLDMPGLRAALSLFEHENAAASVIAAGTEVMRRSGTEEIEVRRAGLLVVDTLRKGDKPADALPVLADLEARLKNPVQKAEAAVLAGQVQLDDLKRYDEAEKTFQRVLKTYAGAKADAQVRRAHIGLGDILRHRGEADKARQSYAAAAAIKAVSYTPAEAVVRVGALSRYVEDYTRQKQWEWAFQNLDDWAWEFPADKLQGHWSLLRAQALFAKGDKAGALLEAMDLLSVNPRSAYAVRLLMLAAECHVAAKQPDKARLLLQTAVEDYPEDPDQDKARECLKALGGPINADKPKM
jgi:PKD repeat protein